MDTRHRRAAGLPSPVTVPVDALTRITHVVGLGTPHVTLAGPAAWLDPDAGRTATDAAWRAFAEVGLADGRTLRPNAADALLILTRPAVEFYGWLTHHDTMAGVLVAAIGGDAVLAVRRHDRVRLATADPNRLPETLVGQLPSIRPGRGRSINLPRSRLRTVLADEHDEDAGVLQPVHDAPPPEVAPFDVLARLPRIGSGELYVAVRDRRTGRRSALPQPIRYADTAEGRWLVQTVPGHDDTWVSVTPGNTDRLLIRLREAHRSLPDRTVTGPS